MTKEFEYYIPILRLLAKKYSPNATDTDLWATPLLEKPFSFRAPNESANYFFCKICHENVIWDEDCESLIAHGTRHIKERNLLPFI